MRLRASKAGSASTVSGLGNPISDLAQAQPSLDLNFAYNKNLVDSVSGNELVTFTRASTATYVDSDGVIKSKAANTPRFDHDLVTGKSLGLLIEEARTNIVLKSEKLNDWIVGGGSSVTANQATAPDGTTTADRVQHGSGGSSWIRQDVLTSGKTYTVSVYAKAVNPGTDDQFTFDLGGLSSVFTATNQWQRFTFTGTASNAAIYLNNGDDTFATDVYFWGAQVEEASFASSYIPTDSASVTRAADVAQITGTNFTSFYNQSEGTVFAEAVSYPHPITSKALVPIAFSDNSYANRITLASSTATNQFNFDVTTGNSLQRANVGNFASTGLKVAGAYKSTGSAGSIDGASAVTSSTPNIASTINRLDIGNAHDSSQFINGHIKQLVYFSTRIPDANLQYITA